MKRYTTWYNGMNPYSIMILPTEVQVYNFVDEGDSVTLGEFSGPIYSNLALTIENPQRVLVGECPTFPNAKGNSVLVHEQEGSYIFIGDQLFRFWTDEPIEEYYSPVGRSDVPYPYALTHSYVIVFPDCKRMIRNSETESDPTQIYYGHKECSTPLNQSSLRIEKIDTGVHVD